MQDTEWTVAKALHRARDGSMRDLAEVHDGKLIPLACPPLNLTDWADP